MSEYYFICSKLLTEGEIVTVQHGMKTLINASTERADEFTEYLKEQKSVTIHVECRKNYTRKCSIAAIKRQHEVQEASTSIVGPPRTRARVRELAYCLIKQCLFCSQELNEEYEKRKSLDSRPTTRSDAMANAVLARLEFENDLIAAEADCFISFLKPHTGVKVGRPQDETTNLAMKEKFTYIENSDYRQFTMNELRNVCKTTTVDNRTLKVRLKLRYGNKIIITEKSGTSTFICLVDNHHDILNQAWYEKKN
ncbi:unnamed protein product [Psylliodes chrysocephalus]|uniref:Uncharacterized protein n=1 Tax=Psylliodes chrysocephalus TaxID=3402493 RepID=A0A9P0G7T9_9CUCU|nr:unnamed protein product [Psylliodes chrysocephala]